MQKMIERIKYSLLAPKKIANYGSDKFGRVLLYLTFWILLISVPFIIDIYTTPLFDSRYQEVIKDAFEKNEIIDVRIVNSQLISAKEDPYVVNIKGLNLTLIFDEVLNIEELAGFEDLQSVLIWLGKEKVFLLYQPAQGFNVVSLELAQYQKLEPINNIDFTKAQDPNDSAFWEKFFIAMDEVVSLHITQIRFSYAAITIFDSLGVLIGSILLISVLIKLFKSALPVTFKEIFKIVTYSYTPYALGLLLSVLYGVSWIDDVGMIISVIYANIATTELIKNKMINSQERNQ